jgi:hypothetical protein
MRCVDRLFLLSAFLFAAACSDPALPPIREDGGSSDAGTGSDSASGSDTGPGTDSGGPDGTTPDASIDTDAALADAITPADDAPADAPASADGDAAHECATSSDCAPDQACDPSTSRCSSACSSTAVCNGGCCDGANCQPGTTNDACGVAASSCVSCTGDDTCQDMPGPSVRRELRRSRHHRSIVWDGLHELRHDLPPGGYVQLLVGQLQRNGDV